MTSALAGLLQLPDVAASLASARSAADAVLASRSLRRTPAPVATETNLQAAVASAALEGHGYDVETVRSGTVTDPVVQGALRVNESLVNLAPRWITAPRQVLARLHMLAARDCVDPSELGRPASASVVARLDLLSSLLTSSAPGIPALLRSAVVHGELLALRPFAGPSGVVARAAARLTLIADGLDPSGLLAVEVGHVAREPEYVGCANAFSTGTPDGVRAWIKHVAMAVESASAELSRRV